MERDEQRKEVNGSWRKSGSRWEKGKKIELEREIERERVRMVKRR